MSATVTSTVQLVQPCWRIPRASTARSGAPPAVRAATRLKVACRLDFQRAVFCSVTRTGELVVNTGHPGSLISRSSSLGNCFIGGAERGQQANELKVDPTGYLFRAVTTVELAMKMLRISGRSSCAVLDLMARSGKSRRGDGLLGGLGCAAAQISGRRQGGSGGSSLHVSTYCS